MPLNHERGLCLTELMCALGIGSMLVALAFHGLGTIAQQLRAQQDAMGQTQEVRLGLAVWEADVRAMLPLVDAGAPSLSRASASEVQFQANVHDLETVLSAPADAGQTLLAVNDAAGWPEGKEIRLCSQGACLVNRLLKDGTAAQLVLAEPLGRALPVGSTIVVVNDVRYYRMEAGAGRYKLMRSVDGGAASLMGELTKVEFQYFTEQRNPTTDAAQIRRVRLTVEPSSRQTAHRPIMQDVALRS